jgi:hypothetical protein
MIHSSKLHSPDEREHIPQHHHSLSGCMLVETEFLKNGIYGNFPAPWPSGGGNFRRNSLKTGFGNLGNGLPRSLWIGVKAKSSPY